MNKKDFSMLLSAGDKPKILTSSLGDGLCVSVSKRIMVKFEKVNNPEIIKDLFKKNKLFKPIGIGYENTFVIQSFYFGYIGKGIERSEKDWSRLSKAKSRYEKWKNEKQD